MRSEGEENEGVQDMPQGVSSKAYARVIRRACAGGRRVVPSKEWERSAGHEQSACVRPCGGVDVGYEVCREAARMEETSWWGLEGKPLALRFGWVRCAEE